MMNNILESNIDISMIRANLDDLPDYSLPDGFVLQPYQPGDRTNWVKVQTLSDEYNPISEALFLAQFGEEEDVLARRQFFLCTRQGEPIGSASAWFGNPPYKKEWGRVHWVAIVPKFQGQKLAKPLLSAVCNRLKALGHETTYMTTSTGRIPAINLYLGFGFRPEIKSPRDQEIWTALKSRLKWPKP